MTKSKHTRRQFLARTAATGAVVIGATGLASAEGTNDFPGIFGHQMEVEREWRAFLRGWFTGARTINTPSTTVTLADRARNEFVANQDAWISYGNWLIDEHGGVPTEEAVIGLDFAITQTGSLLSLQTGRTETAIYATLDSDAGEVESIEWVLEAPDSPDYHVTLENDAAQGAADELQSYRREWIDMDGDDHALPTDEYLNELAGEYWTNLRLGADSKSIVQVILGEVSV